MLMKVSEALQIGLQKFGPNGEHWVNRPPTARGEEYCTITAVPPIVSFDSMGRYRDHGLVYIRKAIGLPESVDDKPYSRLGKEWNDRPERTWADVKAAYEKAIELAEADGN